MTMPSQCRLLRSVLAFCFAIATTVAGSETVSQMSAADATTHAVSRRGFDALFQLPRSVKPALAQTDAALSCASLSNTRPSESSMVRDSKEIRNTNGASSWCRVTIEMTSPASPDVVTVWLGLPIDNWNGRFLGLGGGGWVAGFPAALAEGVERGFATVVTNAGRRYDFSTDPAELARMSGQGAFLLDDNGRLDWIRLQNFAYRGVHEMTVVGKAVATEFYGTKPRYAYFSGCSTGGRQGQSETQRYPDDYDGVMSGAPAINWAHFVAAESWQGAITNAHHTVPQCKFDAAYRAALDACDADDGIRDGLISILDTCHFDAHRLIGTQTDCGVVDQDDADVIDMLWEGPRRHDGAPLWNGIDRAARIHPLFVPQGPLPFGDAQLAHPSTLSIRTFETQFDEFIERYGGVMDTSNPDLGAFAKHGGKTILWHGIADDIIPAAGSVRYVQSIRHALGNVATDSFLRLYLAPGVGHCTGGDGPPPVGLFESLMTWVEQGHAPAVQRSEKRNDGGGIERARPLCPYPEYARYRGHGSLDEAGSFACRQ
jgi:hypothetical protein